MSELIEWPGSDDLAERAGQCYTLAMECVLHNARRLGSRLFLVHGLLHPARSTAELSWREQGTDVPVPPINPHAWVEIDAEDGTLALDPVLRLAWTRAEHERMFGSETLRRYRADVAIDVAMRNRSYGPWDKRSLAEWHQRQEAARADPRFSQAAALQRFLSRAGEVTPTT